MLVSSIGIDRDARDRVVDGRRAAGPDRNPPREPAAAGRSDGAARRRRHGHGHRRRAEGRRRPEAAAVDPRRLRRHLQEQQKSFRDLATVLVLAIVLIFLVLLFEFRSFTPPIAILSSAILSTSGVFLALLDHADDVQRVVVHGPDHGDRHRREERDPAARRQREVPGDRLVAGGSDHSGRAPPVAADRR